jgi:hypothetical protein
MSQIRPLRIISAYRHSRMRNRFYILLHYTFSSGLRLRIQELNRKV